jgi:hypothetical protein
MDYKEPKQVLLDNLHKWTLLARLHAHVQNFTSRLTLADELAEVEAAWLYRFAELNLEVSNGSSCTDLLFIIRCYCLVVHYGCSKTKLSVGDIKHILTKLRVWSCNHTDVYHPSDEELRNIELQIAEIVVFIFCQPHEKLLSTYVLIEDVKIQPALNKILELATIIRPDESPEDYIERRKKTSDYGTYWDDKIESMIKNFIPIYSRLLHKHVFDRALLSVWPIEHMTPHIVTPAMRSRLESWITECCELQVSDAFERKWRDLTFEWCLPDNERFAKTRSIHTQDYQGALTVLEDCFGVEIATYIQSYVAQPLPTLAKDTKSWVYPMLVYQMTHYMLSHQYPDVSFLDDKDTPNVLVSWRIVSKYKEFSLKTKFGFVPRRPIITVLNKSWYVHDKSKWYACKDAIDALLLWMLYVRHDYESELASYTKIHSFLNLILLA